MEDAAAPASMAQVGPVRSNARAIRAAMKLGDRLNKLPAQSSGRSLESRFIAARTVRATSLGSFRQTRCRDLAQPVLAAVLRGYDNRDVASCLDMHPRRCASRQIHEQEMEGIVAQDIGRALGILAGVVGESIFVQIERRPVIGVDLARRGAFALGRRPSPRRGTAHARAAGIRQPLSERESTKRLLPLEKVRPERGEIGSASERAGHAHDGDWLVTPLSDPLLASKQGLHARRRRPVLYHRMIILTATGEGADASDARRVAGRPWTGGLLELDEPIRLEQRSGFVVMDRSCDALGLEHGEKRNEIR
jgi:hypothetical protein